MKERGGGRLILGGRDQSCIGPGKPPKVPKHSCRRKGQLFEASRDLQHATLGHHALRSAGNIL